jgi:hypothetical protein
MSLTKNQKAILEMAQAKGGQFTKQDAVATIGAKYYANEDKHVGTVLSRMVTAGLLIREKPGHYRLTPSQAQKTKPTDTDHSQLNLF